ncbi:MAG: hypothetical protein M0R17_05220 [Candidatus Omnitrophica bacterium]|jgi:hypothetical protein|nr:hypothetical protein [Candidatus Omnitrophota bacterium]
MDQKKLVQNLISTGLTHDQAFSILGLVCEENQNAYMDGYIKGYNDYFKLNLPNDFIEI